MRIVNPKNWKNPKGYSNGIIARGELLFISGQIGWNEKEELVGKDFISQVGQALANVHTILKEGGGRPTDLVKMTWFVKDKKQYLAASKELGSIYQSYFGKHYPAMTLVEVTDLLCDGALVEIEAMAVI